MGTSNRAALLVKTHKVLKKHYTPVAPGDRPLLSQLLFSLCLENSSYEGAEKVIAELEKGFFDWNEVRVSTVSELAELMTPLRDPKAQAANLKRALQSVFEATYSFDLEAMKKKNLGQAIKELEKMAGITPFAIGYITQTSLGGHAIPLDRGALDALVVLGIASEKEAESGAVPGVERAIPKNKGVEFGSLLHQLGVDLLAKPFSNEVRDIFLSIAADAKDRLPKRGVKKPEPIPAPAPAKPARPAAEASEKVAPPAAKAKGKEKTQPPAKPEPAPKAISPAKSTPPAKAAPPAKKPPPPAKKEADSKRGKPAAKPDSKKLAKSKPR